MTRSHPLRMRSVAAGFFLFFCVFATVAQAADSVPVAIKDFAFSPANLTVPAGTTVVWTNVDDDPHLVVSTAKAFESDALDTNETFKFKFDVAGSYAYFCSLHPHMTGTITVTPKG